MSKSKRRKEPATKKASTKKKPQPALLPAVGLCLLAACLQFIAFPGVGVWPLAFVAIVPWFFVLDAKRDGQRHSLKRVFFLALLWGTVANAGGFYWIVGMLENFSGFPFVICVLFALIVWAFKGGLMTLFSLLYFRARGRGWPAMLAAPMIFMACEMWYPLLFQYYHAAHLVDVTPLIQIADLGGPILVSALYMVVNVAIYTSVRDFRETRKVGRRDPAIAIGFVALSLVYGFIRIGQVESMMAEAPKLTVGMVQANMGIFEKRQDFVEGRQRHIEDTIQLQHDVDPDLVVWPESAYSSFLPPGTTNVSQYVTGPVSVPLIFGGLERRAGDDRERHYNTAFLVDETGDVLGSYDKTYLLAFGEYLPFAENFPILYEWSPNSGRFTPGDHVRPLNFGDYRITALACYEDIIPSFTRSAVLEGDPHLLVNITNDAWFGDTSEPWQHLALAQFRAIEHHRYLVRSTNSGVSAFIDPLGRIVKQSGVFTRENLHTEVAMMNPWTVYGALGDWPGWLGTLLTIFVCWRRREPTRNTA